MPAAKKPLIIDGVTHWECSRCKEWKPESEFHPSKQGANGLRPNCKKCHVAVLRLTRDPEKVLACKRRIMKNARLRDPEKFKGRDSENGQKRRGSKEVLARRELNLAIKRGEMVRPSKCEECPSTQRIEAHHPDYDKPLEVKWLCSLCHGKTKRKSA